MTGKRENRACGGAPQVKGGAGAPPPQLSDRDWREFLIAYNDGRESVPAMLATALNRQRHNLRCARAHVSQLELGCVELLHMAEHEGMAKAAEAAHVQGTLKREVEKMRKALGRDSEG